MDLAMIRGRTPKFAVGEQAIEPEVPLIDPHHHIRDPKGGERYLVPEFTQDIYTGHNILATVVIEECAMFRRDGPPELRPLGEVEFHNGVAAMFASGRYGPTLGCAGIVGFANLMLGDRIAPVLDAQIAAASGRLKGIRVSAHWHESYTPPLVVARRQILGLDTPPRMLLDDGFRRGIACLAPRNLSFDVSVYHTQIPELIDLARAFPETRMVAGHCVLPFGWGPYFGKTKEVFEAWSKSVRELARCENVSVKLSGFRWAAVPVPGHEMDQFGEFSTPPSSEALANAWRPYLDTCIEAFGTTRCMFASNFPGERAVCSYGTLWNAFKRASKGYSKEERTALFSGTAIDFYRLPALPELTRRAADIAREFASEAQPVH